METQLDKGKGFGLLWPVVYGRVNTWRKAMEGRAVLVRLVYAIPLYATSVSIDKCCSPFPETGEGYTVTKGKLCPIFRQIRGG